MMVPSILQLLLTVGRYDSMVCVRIARQICRDCRSDMMKRISVLVIAIGFIVIALPSFAQTKKETDDVPTVAYCDLIREPARYDRKTVRVKVTYMNGFEISAMYNTGCDRKDTWVEFDSFYENATNPKMLKKFRKLAFSKSIFKERRVEVTWVGQFQGLKRTQQLYNETVSFGFGHLGGYDYQFNVLRVEDVDIVLNNAR